MTLQQIQGIKNGRGFAFIICTQSLAGLMFGGLCTGSGVVVMHYLGMSAMSFPGEITWNISIMCVSILIALGASTVAFWILFRLLSLYPQKEVLRVGSACIMTLAVCGMHYTGMAAAHFTYHPDMHTINTSNVTLSSQKAFQISFAATLCFVIFLVILIFADLRAWLYAVTANLKRADDFMDKLQHARPSDARALIVKYVHVRDQNRSLNGSLNGSGPSHKDSNEVKRNSFLMFSPRLDLSGDNTPTTTTVDRDRTLSYDDHSMHSIMESEKDYKVLNKPTIAMKEAEKHGSAKIYTSASGTVLNILADSLNVTIPSSALAAVVPFVGSPYSVLSQVGDDEDVELHTRRSATAAERLEQGLAVLDVDCE
eukprot:gene29720-36812_t